MSSRPWLVLAFLPALLPAPALPGGPAGAPGASGDEVPVLLREMDSGDRVALAASPEAPLPRRWEAIRLLSPGDPHEARALLALAATEDLEADLRREAVLRIEVSRDPALWSEVLCCCPKDARLLLLDHLDHTLGSVNPGWDRELLALYSMALRDADAEVRSAALEEIGADPFFAAFDGTEELLRPVLHGDREPGLRARAVSLLGSLPGGSALRTLLDLLRDEDDPAVAEEAARAIASHPAGSQAVDEAVRLFRSGDPGVRRRLAGLLGDRAFAAAVPDLVNALSDADPAVRGGAATSLGALHRQGVLSAEEGVADLARLAADPREEAGVRSRALAALAAISCGDPALWESALAILQAGAGTSPPARR